MCKKLLLFLIVTLFIQFSHAETSSSSINWASKLWVTSNFYAIDTPVVTENFILDIASSPYEMVYWNVSLVVPDNYTLDISHLPQTVHYILMEDHVT